MHVVICTSFLVREYVHVINKLKVQDPGLPTLTNGNLVGFLAPACMYGLAAIISVSAMAKLREFSSQFSSHCVEQDGYF